MLFLYINCGFLFKFYLLSWNEYLLLLAYVLLSYCSEILFEYLFSLDLLYFTNWLRPQLILINLKQILLYLLTIINFRKFYIIFLFLIKTIIQLIFQSTLPLQTPSLLFDLFISRLQILHPFAI